MVGQSFCLLVAASVLLTLHPCLGRPSDPQPVKTYDIDLGKAPDVRWNEVLDDFKFMLPEVLAMIRSYIPSAAEPILEKIADDIENLLPSPFAQEIIGSAKHWGIKVEDAILMNIVYDFTAFCTSIVGQDSAGNIWHGRNLDYDTPDILRNTTVQVNFIRGNETLYTATTYAGYVGILTGQRPKVFTVSIDQRGVKDRRVGPWWLDELNLILDHNSSFVTFLVRQTLEESRSFSEAVTKLSTTVIHAPVYAIVGGAHQGEGVVITRDRTGALDRYYLDPLFGRWYVVETNYDLWTSPPPVDAERRAVAHKEMDKLGADGLNAAGLYHVLSTAPVLNNITTYTTIMSAANPEIYNTTARWPPP